MAQKKKKKSRAKKTKPQLRVVLDTNVLYTGSVHYLVNRDIAETITESATHADLAVVWHLPDVVVDERRYQMNQEGERLLPWIDKMERLLGRKLAITPQIIGERIDAAIEAHLETLGIKTLPVALDDVDWAEVIRRSVERLPPFDAGEKEKGFRDAIICEAFCQLVFASPVTPDVCRVVLVTEDKRLREAASERTNPRKNVHVFASIDELEGLINTLVAAVGEEFVEMHRDRARRYFFTNGDDKSLFYKEGVWEQVRSQYSSELASLPAGAAERENVKRVIGHPQFVSKERRRVSWSSRITLEDEAYRGGGITVTGLPPSTPSSVTQTAISAAWVSTPVSIHEGVYGASKVPSYLSTARRVLVAKGRSVFEVIWSVSIADDGVFRTGRVDEINFVETLWE